MDTQRKWWALGALALSLLVVGLDLTILNVALPTLATELDASTGAAAVVRRRVQPRARRGAAAGGDARRPLRAQADAADRRSRCSAPPRWRARSRPPLGS